MRIMTWNLLWRRGGDYAERAPRIDSVLLARAPDILGVVETWSGGGTTQPHELARALGASGRDRHAVFAPSGIPPAPVPIEYPEQAGMEMGIGILSAGRGGRGRGR